MSILSFLILQNFHLYNPITLVVVGEPKSRIVQNTHFFAPERYTAGILYTDSLDSAWYETTV